MSKKIPYENTLARIQMDLRQTGHAEYDITSECFHWKIVTLFPGQHALWMELADDSDCCDVKSYVTEELLALTANELCAQLGIMRRNVCARRDTRDFWETYHNIHTMRVTRLGSAFRFDPCTSDEGRLLAAESELYFTLDLLTQQGWRFEFCLS